MVLQTNQPFALLIFIAIGLLCTVAGCDRESESEGDETQPRWMTPETDAEEVAARIFERHGGPNWDELETLAFTFVLVDGDDRVAEIEHDWDIDAGTDRIQWRDDDGRAWDVVLDIDAETAQEAFVDGQPATGMELKEARDQGYRRWINDTYWLLMPIKLFDPGVSLSLADTSSDGENHDLDVLKLQFDSVGLTPGDRYFVRADRDNGEIRGWKMQLEGRQEIIDIEWDGYESVGLLSLPLERNWKDEERHILFEDVSAQ